VARIATGEVNEEQFSDPLGRAGGVARATQLAPSRRSEIATAAATARWQSGDYVRSDVMQTAKKETVTTNGRKAVCMYPNNSLKEPVREYHNVFAEVVKASFTN
jgi:hypothetical protein